MVGLPVSRMHWNPREFGEGFLIQMCQKASWDTLTGIAPRVEKPQDELHAMAGYSFLFSKTARNVVVSWIIFVCHRF